MRALLLAGVVVLGWTGAAQAATITFETASFESGVADPVTENGFSYSRLSGVLFVNRYGNPGQDMEGQQKSSGGVLNIAAAGSSPTFVFSALDYAAYDASGLGSQTLTVTGLLGGSVVGTEAYTLANTSSFGLMHANWTTETASNLSGKTIDDLRITLNANSPFLRGSDGGGSFVQAIDNVVLAVSPTAVPEPASLALLGVGAAGIAAVRRRRVAWLREAFAASSTFTMSVRSQGCPVMPAAIARVQQSVR